MAAPLIALGAVALEPALSQSPLAPSPDPAAEAAQARERVVQLGRRARTHARRLGLRPAPAPRPAAAPEALRRQVLRWERVVAFLAARRELERPVDARPVPRALAPGRTAAARAAHHHRSATRLALRLGVDRPAPLGAGAASHDRRAQIARWRAVATWLAARRERVRPAERPLSERIPHYDALMCIARHESGGRWSISTGNGYYGGLQMDRTFQATYAPALYRRKGTADRWTPQEQLRAAARAVASRGFSPWPSTARMCGLM